MVIDLTDYKTASRLSPHINAGASARLSLQPLVTSLTGEAGQAFAHGWRTTDVAENKAGRPMPRTEDKACGRDGRRLELPAAGCFNTVPWFGPAATSMVGA